MQSLSDSQFSSFFNNALQALTNIIEISEYVRSIEFTEQILGILRTIRDVWAYTIDILPEWRLRTALEILLENTENAIRLLIHDPKEFFRLALPMLISCAKVVCKWVKHASSRTIDALRSVALMLASTVMNSVEELRVVASTVCSTVARCASVCVATTISATRALVDTISTYLSFLF